MISKENYKGVFVNLRVDFIRDFRLMIYLSCSSHREERIHCSRNVERIIRKVLFNALYVDSSTRCQKLLHEINSAVGPTLFTTCLIDKHYLIVIIKRLLDTCNTGLLQQNEYCGNEQKCINICITTAHIKQIYVLLYI